MKLFNVKNLCFVLLVVLVIAISSGAFAAPKTIVFWTRSLQSFDKEINGYIAEFQKLNPDIKVQWVDVPYLDLEKVFTTAYIGKKAPDIVNLRENIFPPFAQQGMLIPLDKLISKQMKDKFIPGMYEASRFDGKIYGLPWYGASGELLYYNKKLFAKEGIKNPPTTWSEVLEFAKKLTKDTNNDGRTDQWGFLATIDVDAVFPMYLVYQNNGSIINDQRTKAIFDSPEAIEAVDWYVNAYKKSLVVPPDAMTNTTTQNVQLFQTGNVGMFVTGTWVKRLIRDNSPDLVEDIGVVPLPKLKKAGSLTQASNLCITSQCKYQKEALKFIDFVVSNPKNVMAFMNKATVLPGVKSVLSDPHWKAEELAADLNQLPNSTVERTCPGYRRVQEQFRLAIQSAMQGKVTTKDALTAAAAESNKIIQEESQK